MNKNDISFDEWAEIDCDEINLDDLEAKLEEKLELEKAELESIELDRAKISNPDALGDTVNRVIDEQINSEINKIKRDFGSGPKGNNWTHTEKSENKADKENLYTEEFVYDEEKNAYVSIEEKNTESGKKTKEESSSKMGSNLSKSALMALLGGLVRETTKNLVQWLKSKEKSISSFIESVKSSIKNFFENITHHLKNAAKNIFSLSNILKAVFGPIVGTLKKAWSLIKHGWRSLKEAVEYLRSPEAKKAPFSVKMAQVSKIIIGGLAAGGSIILSEIIEKGLSVAFPPLCTPIPGLGSAANIIGIALGAIVSGILGAVGINLINKFIAKKLKSDNTSLQIEKRNEIIKTQTVLTNVTKEKTINTVGNSLKNIAEQHKEAGLFVNENSQEIDKIGNNLQAYLNKLF